MVPQPQEQLRPVVVGDQVVLTDQLVEQLPLLVELMAEAEEAMEDLVVQPRLQDQVAEVQLE